MMFAIGERVNRLENREVTGATVIAIEESPDGTIYKIEYDEGGTGWWPESALEPA